MLPPHVGESRGTLAALQRDFARIRMLEHPHIARVLELGHNGHQYYVTGERLDGEPLRDVLTHLSPERLTISEADDVVRTIGSALVFAHEQDIAHGDVRAENVIVTMDRRFMLTNFLARRVAKISARPPRAADDLKGLARLAAELYTGSTSPQALRAAMHGTVPAARLNAIRAVLEGPNRRLRSVAEFLDAAGLRFVNAGGTLRKPARPDRAWPIWRFALPIAAAAALGIFLVSNFGDVGTSAEEITGRGLDALRAVASRVAPPAPAPANSEKALTGKDLDVPRGVGPDAPTGSGAPDAEEPAPIEPAPSQPAQPQPAEARPAAATPPARRASPTPETAMRATSDPAVLSLGTPKIAAREDHSVVAIDIVRSGDTKFESAVGWWTTPDTAHADDDYANLGRQTVKFPAGATVERVLIPIVNDGVREADEAFTVHLSRPQGGVTGTVTATRVTVYDDD
jgi:serine/threonine protein kinase